MKKVITTTVFLLIGGLILLKITPKMNQPSTAVDAMIYSWNITIMMI
jgi:hypothetical protein